MNYIATWIYLDQKGEETNYPQTEILSSSKAHQEIYWRCVYIFFKFAIKYMGDKCKFILFTNFSGEHLLVNNIDVILELKTMNVQIVQKDFTYKLPKGYYGEWGNQLYEFDILNAFSKQFEKDSRLLMLDSDCLITKDISNLFEMLDSKPAVVYRSNDYKNSDENEKINGISEREMTDLINEYLKTDYSLVHYMCGEFFCARYDFIKQIADEFPPLWKHMVKKFEENPTAKCIKFNEEAHFLSLFYVKNGLTDYIDDTYIKRLWTADNYYVIKEGDDNLPIWHVLSGKNRYIKLIKNIDSFLGKKQSYIIRRLKKLFFKMNSKYEKKNIFIRIYNKIKRF